MSTNPSSTFGQQHNNDRRALDSLNLDLMIADENDPSRRALLLVLSAIANNVSANTHTTESISKSLEVHLESFKEHADQETALLNGWKGASKIIVWVFSIAQIVITASIIHIGARFTDIEADIASLQLANVQLSADINRSHIK
jgi:hypothetical protein